MIQDIFPHKMHNEYHPDVVPGPDDIVFCFEGAKLFMKEAGDGAAPDEGPAGEHGVPISVDGPAGETDSYRGLFRLRDLALSEGEASALTYLFSIDTRAFFLWRGQGEIPVRGAAEQSADAPASLNGAAGQCADVHASMNGAARQSQGAPAQGSDAAAAHPARFVDIRALRDENRISPEMAFAVYTAKHLADWYRDNRFCGRCGKPMEHSKKERAMVCANCGSTVYPRIMPAVIVGVTKGDELLITKYRTGFRHNALIAGFTEIGETLEETVQREVMEEAGIRVKNIRYYKSQPWGLANDILVGFYCEVDGDSKIRMDENELSYAEWTKRADIVLQPDNYSLTNEMMRKFAAAQDR